MSYDRGNTYTHYTDKRGFQGIKNSGVIRASTDTTNDAAFGQGTYSTTRDPAKSNAYDIAKNNYDGSPSYYQGLKKQGRVDYGIKYTDPSSSHMQVDPYQTQGRDVHMYPGDVDLGQMENVQYFRKDRNDHYRPIRK